MRANPVAIAPAKFDECIVNAAAQVLEKMFFTGFEATGSEGEIETVSPIQVELSFSGPLEGRLRLWMDEETARSLGTTLTCVEEGEFTRECCIQVAGELANMICGCLLSQLEPDANMALTTPEEVVDAPALEGGLRRWFCLPEGALAVEFALDPMPHEELT